MANADLCYFGRVTLSSIPGASDVTFSASIYSKEGSLAFQPPPPSDENDTPVETWGEDGCTDCSRWHWISGVHKLPDERLPTKQRFIWTVVDSVTITVDRISDPWDMAEPLVVLPPWNGLGLDPANESERPYRGTTEP